MTSLEKLKARTEANLAFSRQVNRELLSRGINVMDMPVELDLSDEQSLRDFALYNWGVQCAMGWTMDRVNEEIGAEILAEARA